MTTSALAPTVALRHGAAMARLGLGTSPMDDAETERAVAAAIEAGYRLIDTAQNYANELGAGRGLKAVGIARQDVFVTTKFNKRWHGVELVEQAFEVAPFGALVGGLLAELIGVRPTVAIAVAGGLLKQVWLVRSPLRQLRGTPDLEAPEVPGRST